MQRRYRSRLYTTAIALYAGVETKTCRTTHLQNRFPDQRESDDVGRLVEKQRRDEVPLLVSRGVKGGQSKLLAVCLHAF